MICGENGNIRVGSPGPEFNKETQLFPISGLAAAQLNNKDKSGELQASDGDGDGFKPLAAIAERHHALLSSALTEKPASAWTMSSTSR